MLNHWTRRIVSLLVIIIPISVTAQDDAPPGTLYTVNDTTLHVYCEGEGDITVLLESGVGGFTLNWTEVQPSVAERTRVCSYDRRGYGWSDRLEGPFEMETAVEDLHTLLAAAEVEPPYVIVAHSFGAVVARAYMDTHPGEVVGVMFLDAVHPQMPKRVDGYPAALERQFQQLDLFVGLFGSVDGDATAPFMPDGADGLYLQKALEPKFIAAARAEADWLVNVMPTYDLPETLGDLPLIVVRHGIPERVTFLGAPVGRDAAIEAEATWQMLQREFTTLTSDARLVVADDSQHSIQFDQPELVLDLLDDLLDAVA